MPRFATSLLLIAAAAAGVGLGIYLHRLDKQAREAERALVEPTANSGALQAGLANIVPVPAEADGPDQATGDETLGAIEGERLFSFPTSGALDEFTAKARAAGLELIAINRKLRTARVATPDDASLASARDLAGPDAHSETNQIILTPIPISASVDPGRPFEAAALAYIGVPTDNHSWGKGVTIAILDTGILDHPSLVGATIEQIDLVKGDDANYSAHGTAVASLIAGQLGNGVAPDARILDVRVLDADGIGDAYTLAEGIIEATDRGANVINMSLGGFGYSRVLEDAVNYARSNGVILVAAAGNDGVTALPYPAQLDGVIAVAAINADGDHSAFSNQGSAIDLSAPGVGLYAAWSDEQWVSFTGTSASAPLVTGAVAALASIDSDRDFEDAAARLLANANDTGAPGQDAASGLGIIDLQRALRSGEKGIYDFAVSDIYLSPEALGPNQATLIVSTQNRGTEILPTTSVEVTLPTGNTQTINLGRLEPGQVASYSVFVDTLQLESESGYRLSARAVISNGSNDANPANDVKQVVFGPNPAP